MLQKKNRGNMLFWNWYLIGGKKISSHAHKTDLGTSQGFSGADPGFHRGGFNSRRRSPVEGSGASSEIQVLGNAISDILRPSHGVLKYRFFKPKCHSY